MKTKPATIIADSRKMIVDGSWRNASTFLTAKRLWESKKNRDKKDCKQKIQNKVGHGYSDSVKSECLNQSWKYKIGVRERFRPRILWVRDLDFSYFLASAMSLRVTLKIESSSGVWVFSEQEPIHCFEEHSKSRSGHLMFLRSSSRSTRTLVFLQSDRKIVHQSFHTIPVLSQIELEVPSMPFSCALLLVIPLESTSMLSCNCR